MMPEKPTYEELERRVQEGDKGSFDETVGDEVSCPESTGSIRYNETIDLSNEIQNSWVKDIIPMVDNS